VKPDYLPGIEGMDEEHPSCSPTARKALVAARYLSRDFFEAMLDFCDENEGIALYRTSTVSYSSLVLAMPAQLRPLNVQVLNGLRPTTERDKEDVLRQKKALELARDCTTTPAYIDSAGRLAEVTLSGGITLALSSYQTPGCAGHLAEIYILDVLQGGNLIHTVFTSRNRGLL
jgi:hypothetical protein